MICAADAEFVAEDRSEIEDRADGGDCEVGICRPDFGVVGPCGTRGGCAIGVRDIVVDVLCSQELGEGHCDGYEDTDGDQEAEDAGYDAESADACFKVLSMLALTMIIGQKRILRLLAMHAGGRHASQSYSGRDGSRSVKRSGEASEALAVD